MNDKPTLKLIRCHRGIAAARLLDLIASKRTAQQFPRIKAGALKGCYRSELAINRRSVYLLGDGHVLEFAVCLRVGR